jgi:hypothetical protein
VALSARLALTATVVLTAVAAIPAHGSTPGTVDPTVPAARDTDPVVLTGKDLLAGSSAWSVPENLTVAIPEKDAQCLQGATNGCGDGTENHYVDPDVDTAGTQSQLPVQGTATNKILGYKWDGAKFVQIPFQVDEVFTRYLNNDASGFGFYSGTDKHTDYAYDREPFRFSANDPADPCKAAPKDGIATTHDPVAGLDSNDELAFMAADAGAQAPAGTALPAGIAGAKVVTITDPTNPTAAPTYVYVMRADDTAAAPKPAYNAGNGYVRYDRDPGYDRLVHERSSNGDYGPGVKGPYCTMDGHLVTNPDGTPKIDRRKEIDTATIYTPRYAWRYDGRWLMTGMQIAQTDQDPWGNNPVYGPDLLDRWKARAFAQDPGSQTPCCGYEEEDTNWGGSSILLGERVGPVRVIRTTWGADSGTNVIRRETFYRDRMVQKNWLRVHVIPPLDGIYAQWDFNAGRMTKFFNDYNMGGINVDGVNDEVYGNWDDPCEPRWDNDPSRTQADQAYRSTYQQAGLCTFPGLSDEEHASIDPGDATFADANAALGWAEVAGPYGAIVDRIHAQTTDQTPGGLAQGLLAVPYYRDDACFDDGTGSDPGPELHPRQFDQEKSSKAPDGANRRCWTPADGPTGNNGHQVGDARGDQRFWQGDIGTHGLHLLFQAESDNARQTVPIDEIVSDWDFVMLPPSQALDAGGRPKNVGEQYGRPLEKPLVAVVTDNVQ